MSYFCIYFQAHQPRRLMKVPSLEVPFDNTLDHEIIAKVGKKCYCPANRLLAEMVQTHPDFRVCLSVTGTLLEQAEKFAPDIVDSFKELARVGQETGRVEFLNETYYHSLSGLFRDPRKIEFAEQVNLHRNLMQDVLGVTTSSFRNTELLYNNSVASAAASMGFKSILCERRGDMVAGHSPNAVFLDINKQIKVLPRNDGLSDELAFRFTHQHLTAQDYAAWISKIDGEMVLIGMDYEIIGEHMWEDSGIFEFWRNLPQSLSEHTNVVMRNPSEIADSVFAGPPADINELSTSSWADEGRNTNAWLGNRAQQELFRRHQDIEESVRKTGDENLMQIWRHLGTSDNLYYMCTTRHGADGGVHDYFSHYSDVSEAIMTYSTLLTLLEQEVRQVPHIHIKKKVQRPRILLVTPEVTELPAGFGNLANYVTAKGGGLADISAALVGELLRLDLDVHIALPKYDRQMSQRAAVPQDELDRMIGQFLSKEAVHLAQDPSFSYLRDVYETHGANTALHRAIAFQRAVINQILSVAMPEHGRMLVHCNDWMTGLIPAAAKVRGLPSLFTVHNIHSDQQTLRALEVYGINVGQFWKELFLNQHPDSVPDPWETVGVDLLLSGIRAADFVNTVSTTFLLEIINGYFPDLIPGQVRQELRAKNAVGAACGILNAPSSQADPRICRDLVHNYDEATLVTGKQQNKTAFQQHLHLEVDPEAPLFFWPHRLYHQKGPHLLEEIALALTEKYWDDGLQIAIVGNGDPHRERAFGSISCGSRGRIAYQHFDPTLSELGKASADFILMPSLYEPCGLPQMEGMRYGTLPIVRATGGLKDTVQHLDVQNNLGNGFVFSDFIPSALWWACSEAMDFYRLSADVKIPIIQRVMRQSREDFSIEKTTLQYVRVYERLLDEKLL